MRLFTIATILLLAPALVPHPAAYSQEPAAEIGETPATTKVSYGKQIEPIFRANCQGCHQPAKPQGAFVMTDFTKLLAGGETGKPAIVPGKPEESGLMEQVKKVDGKAAMPKKANPLNDADVELIARWIAEGAVDDRTATVAEFSAEQPPTYSRLPVVTALAFSPDGKWLAANGFHEVFLIDTQTWKLAKRLVGLSERIESVCFSPDSTRLAVTGGSPGRVGEVQVWDVATGALQLSHQVTYDNVYGGCFSPDGSLIAFGCSDNTVRAIDAVTGEQKLHQGAHEDWIRACVFNPSGTHLLSAGRDMTVKLTEVATERFIDNVTSITPGALRGGINALAIHPQRDEVLVGGSDGAPKIYRIFRETARVIGDDANLIRQFPAMSGRIFSVSMNKDGSQFVAASTLDGTSTVRVYPYGFVGEVPAETQAAMGKKAGERNDKEKELVRNHERQVSEPIASLDFPETSIYAVAFHPAGNSVALAGSDGSIRFLNTESKQIESTFAPIEITNSATEQTLDPLLAKSGTGLPMSASSLPSVEQEQQLLPADKLLEIEVEPQSIKLATTRDYGQLVVTAVYASGQRCDVTRLATYKSDNTLASVSSFGLLRPKAVGNSAIEVSFGGQNKTVAVETTFPEQDTIDFTRDVNPILSRLGCNSGTCHGAQKGRNGFKLSLRGYDPLEDIRALSDDLCQRRLNTTAADASLMLLKPVGTVPHEGGVLLTTDSVHYYTLRKWIDAGAKLNMDSKKTTHIELIPSKPVIELENAWQQFRVVAHYADGSTRDVTQEAFIESGNAEICKSLPGGLAQAIRRGEAPVLARYEGAYAAATLTVMGNRQGFASVETEANNTIDELVAAKWERMKIQPSEVCNDAEFLRRVRLDLTGLPPTLDELKSFLADTRPTRLKRREKIDQLIGNPDYVEHWTNKWADLLQVNSKFLGGEGAKSFNAWIKGAIADNRPYDQFVRDILTASGSNKENPAASYYKILRDPDLIMENTTHLFLAVRFNCNKCHDHPFEKWTQDQYYELAAYFAQTGLKKDPNAGDAKIGGSAVDQAKPLYEVVFDKPDGEMIHVRTNKQVAPKFPYDCNFDNDSAKTRREQLAAWITSPDNPYFARSYVNRLWGYLTGVGLMTPLDDIRAGNPPTNPELLEHLTHEFIRSGFDVEHVLRLICNSRTYQLSVGTNKWNEDDTINYSHATARRLPAEVLYDALYQVTGALSDIPGVAPGTRAAALPDVAVGSPDGFLNNLGRPVRESACECERSGELQLGPVMALISGPTVGKAISDPKCALPQLANTELTDEQLVKEIYLRVLSREAQPAEVKGILEAADSIVLDHAELEKQLAEREQWWADERAKLEATRLAKLEETKTAYSAREQAIAPQRAEMEAERQKKIAAAEQALKTYEEGAVQNASKWLADHAGANHWFPATPTSLAASNGATLVQLADRSIRASGKSDKGTYTLTFRTPLRKIRGIRIETLQDETIPGGGAGLSPNGNFVITEIEVDAAPVAKPNEKQRVAISAAKADFSQESFAPELLINGQAKDQGGWAVHPRSNVVHWATLQTKDPIDIEGGALITVAIHQYHNAENHRLGRFRISFSIDEGDIGLGIPEEFSALATIPEATRNADSLKPLLAYMKVSDKPWLDLQTAVATAKQPLPDDTELVALREKIKGYEVVTADDRKVVQLRTDFENSKQQLANRRLTLAQDLTWALINSPAFLFNH